MATSLPEPAHVCAAGDVVGGVRLLRLIGHGATAEVWRGEPVDQPGGAVAMKVMALRATTDAHARGRFATEAAVMARLVHTNILAVYMSGCDASRAWISMELATGGSVFDHLRRDGALPAAVAVAWCIDVLDALEHAHAHGVIHRDVKPQNLLLDAQGRVCLADFGVAHLSDHRMMSTEPGTTLGSFSYMPPEQRVDAGNVTPASDVYACGATLFAMVTNRSPADLHITPPAHRRWDPVPPPLRPILQRAVAMRPEQRYADARSMADALSACLPALLNEAPFPAPVRLPAEATQQR